VEVFCVGVITNWGRDSEKKPPMMGRREQEVLVNEDGGGESASEEKGANAWISNYGNGATFSVGGQAVRSNNREISKNSGKGFRGRTHRRSLAARNDREAHPLRKSHIEEKNRGQYQEY